MDNQRENILSTEFESLFIKESDGEPDRTLVDHRDCDREQSTLTVSETSALIKPYLQEMDDLLKSCEELTGIPFSSRLSVSCTETSMSETTNLHCKDIQTMECCRERSTSPDAYLSASYIDTRMDGPGTEEQPAQWKSQSMETIINRCGVTPDVSCQKEMPVTSAGNKLSETMVECEDQLLKMLAKLERCMKETGMDFESQDWATDTKHEYVHISKDPYDFMGSMAPIEQDRPIKLDSHRVYVSEDSRNKVTEDSVGKKSQQIYSLGCNSKHGFLEERLDRSENLQTDKGDLEWKFSISGPSIPCGGKENVPMSCGDTEVPETKGDVTWSDDTQHELKMDTTYISSGMNELLGLGSQMEECIQQVQQLKKRRKELVTEVLQLRGNGDQEKAEESNKEEEEEERMNSKVAELMNILLKEEDGRREERKREMLSLREERAEEERRMWKVNLERQGLQDELRKLKRRLFAVARDCAEDQAALNTQHRAVELLKKEEV